jgi:single-stranded-DNA-specific exonuclease
MMWEKQDVDPILVRELSQTYKIDLLTASILARKSLVEGPDVLYYLEDDLRFLHNPFLFEEMEDAVDRIYTAKQEGEKVLVFGDRDVDGITSITVIVEKLKSLGIEVGWELPRGDDPYGLSIKTIDAFAEADGTLIIAVDCGTTNNTEIAYALEKGIETIVLDHHNPQESLPSAAAILNPKIPGSGYPFSGLCGCGVAAKLCWALDFAATDFYKQPVCLLNARPGNDTVVFEAVKLENLTEIDRLSETLALDSMDISVTRLYDFIHDQQIIVYDAPLQEKFLRKAFGAKAAIGLIDSAPEIWKLFPGLEGQSLLKMQSLSRIARYSQRKTEEIDIFLQLFITYAYKKEPALYSGLEEILDLVALGTLADMMPLQDENRILVKNGLRILARSKRPAVRLLLEKQNLLGQKISARDIGWQISPVINATGRMGEPEKAVELFLSEEESERTGLAEEIVLLNKTRKSIGSEAWDRILPGAYESLDEHQGRMILVHDASVHRGITGILASRLVRQFNVPSAVVAYTDDAAIGSIRATRGFGATKFLEYFDDILEDWGGHDLAAGFHMKIPRYEDFRRRFKEVLPRITLEAEGEEKLIIDAEVPPDFLSPDIISVVDCFAPFGEANPPLLFLTRGFKVVHIDLIGKKEQNHIKFLLEAGKYKWPAVFWNGVQQKNIDYPSLRNIDVVYNIRRNFYQNKETLQLSVVDLQECD